MIEIIDYEDKYAHDFRSLNLEWLQTYNLTESHDLEVLDDPRGTVIKAGGSIFLAREGNNIAGTAAIMEINQAGTCELMKMVVAPAFRGRGISKLLIDRCLERAKQLNAKRIILFSNHQLQAALHIYRQFGFIDIPVEESPFKTADVKMELVIHPE